MSRYIVTGKHLRYRITIGVDRPLATFFAQVAESRQGREEQSDSPAEKLLVWVGCSRHEIRAIQQLV